MKKLEQGKYEVFTTKKDAIDKFMQMEGVCRERLSDDSYIVFYCWENGNIAICERLSGRREYEHSTRLFGKVVEQDGKTYVTFYTRFDKGNQVLKVIFLVLSIMIAIASILFSFANPQKSASILLVGLSLAMFVFQLLSTVKEQDYAPKDSAKLVQELERRVQAVNMWDK